MMFSGRSLKVWTDHDKVEFISFVPAPDEPTPSCLLALGDPQGRDLVQAILDRKAVQS